MAQTLGWRNRRESLTKKSERRRNSLRLESLEDRRLLAVIGNNLAVGDELRNYRVAIAATAEYTSFFGGQTEALTAIQTFVDDLNAIFEPELAIHLDLVSGTNVVYTNAASDPYTNNSVSTMLSENQANLDIEIGSANYDIGHVFGIAGSGGQGIAGLGVVGNSSRKARGASISSNPQGVSWLGLAGHEFGHQFGAAHTFNSLVGSCGGGNRSPGNAYEPASGSTVMSYAGICGSDNLQTQEDPVFHSASFEQIETYISTSNGSPNTTTTLSNSIPTVAGGADFTIPAGTPFELTASGVDADSSDILTYSWEQLDLGPAASLPLTDNGSSPLFRAFAPTSDPVRTFPRLSDLLGNVDTAAIGEVLPSTDRDLNFRVTVRDSQGGINSDDVLLTVVDTGGPFAVTSPNSAVSWSGGSSQTISWDVSGTDANEFDAANVQILLSTDGGLTYPFNLATTTNDGSHTIVAPNINTSGARIKIQGGGNIFFDISDTDFSIAANNSGPGFTITESAGSTTAIEGGLTDSYTIAPNTDPAGSFELTLAADGQTQISVDGINFNSTQVLTFSSMTAQTVTVRALNDAVDEGPHISLVQHAVSASSSASYPTTTLIDNVVTQVQDDESGLLIGVDYDFNNFPSPANWNAVQFIGNDQTNVISEDGSVTAVDVNGSPFGGGNINTLGPSSTNMIPQHTPSLVNIGGTTTVNGGGANIDFDDLTPGTSYGVYVFGLDTRSGDYRNDVTIVGETTLPTFSQVLTDGVLHVNAGLGSSGSSLQSYEQVAVADSTGRIRIQISHAGSTGISLAGVAVREIPAILPAVTVVQSGGNTEVTEAGSTDDFEVSLHSAPTSNVVVDILNGDSSELSISETSLTFTPSNWNIPQVVTVTGQNDAADDGDQSTAITLSINDTSSDDTFDSLADLTVNVVTLDDDDAPATSFTVTETGGTSVAEANGTDSFTVVLDSAPASNVEISVVSGDLTEVTVSPMVLVFSPADWDTPQTVTVTGVNDDIDDGDVNSTITVTVDDANSDDAFDAVIDQQVIVTTIDDDTAGFTVTESGGTLVSESGTTDTFTVVLDSEPTSNVVLSVTSGDTDEATVAPASLVFTPADWNVEQIVTVTGVGDQVIDGDVLTDVSLEIVDASSDDVFDSVPNQTVSVTTTDEKVPGFVVVELDGSTTVSESGFGNSDTFTVVLSVQPATSVTIDVTSNGIDEVTVDLASLTFTDSNWDSPQTVTVTGVNDDIDDGDITTTITLSVDDALSDDDFDAIADQSVSVTTTDDDTAGFTIDQLNGVSVAEASGTDTFTLVLDSEPTSNVVLTVSGNDTSEVSVDTSLTFTPANWDDAQIVLVTGVNDDLVDGDIGSLVTVSVDDASSDNAFDGLADQTVAVTTLDDDVAAFTVDIGDGVNVTENLTSDTFTVVLEAEPVSDVVISVVSGNASEATVDTPILTFTSMNWDDPQIVTVTGANDDLIDGTVSSQITLSIVDSSSDDAFDALADQTVAVSTDDNDVAGFTIDQLGLVSLDEDSGTATFTVVLDAQPTSDVVIDVATDDSTEVSVNSPLVFTMADWDAPQTVTITGVGDDIDDGDVNSTVTLSVDDVLSDDAFDAVADATVSVTTIDDETAGISIVELDGTTEVSESGTSDTFTVELNSQPVGDVVLNVTSADTDEAVVDFAVLTFTAANWNEAQTVTVTGVDDMSTDGNVVTAITVAVNDSMSDDVYDSVADQIVSVTTIDDDAPGFTITGALGGVSVAESGTGDTFTVELNTQPTTEVVIDINIGDSSEVSVVPISLTFDSTNWDQPQTVTATGVDDDIDDGDVRSVLALSVDVGVSDATYSAVPSQAVNVTTTDDDTAGFTVTESGTGTTVDEAGGTDDFTVVLDSEPTTDIVISVASADTNEVTVDALSLTFTPTNWDVAQTVTVTGVDNDVDDGDASTLITVSVVDGGSDPLYEALADQAVSATSLDDDAVGFTVSESGPGTSVTEAGDVDDTLSVVLESQPISPVVLLISSDNADEASVDPVSLTFTPVNWDSAQIVTVNGVDDDLDDGDVSSVISVSVDAANSDDTFDGLATQTVAVTTVDDDTAGFTITQAGPIVIAEDSGTGVFSVALDARPTSEVVIDVTSGDLGEATVAPMLLTFTSANWNVGQEVTVTGVPDDLIDGDVDSTITLGIDSANSDVVFGAVANQSLTVTTTDDDVAAFLVLETGMDTVVTEDGGIDMVTVELLAEPATNVVINVSSGDIDEVTVDPAVLTFTAADWDQPQAVTLTGADDQLTDGTIDSVVTFSIDDGNSDPNFGGVADQFVIVSTTDNDTPGFTVVETGDTRVDESGTADSFTVVLNREPASDVVIDVASGDLGEVTSTPASLTFSPADWDIPQLVTVTGVNDSIDDGDQTSAVTLAVNDALSDDAYDNLADEVVTVTTVDDDTAGFTLSKTSATVSESGGIDTFSVVLVAEPISDVVIMVSSGNADEATVGPAMLTFSPANWDIAQTVTVTGANDFRLDGDVQSTITLSIDGANSDDAFDALSDQTVGVTTTDDDVAGFTIVETNGTTSVAEVGGTDSLTVVLDAEPASDVVLTVLSSDSGEASVSPAVLTFTPQNWDSAQTIDVSGVVDGVVDGDQVVTLTISVDDPMSDAAFGAVADATVAVEVTDSDGNTDVTPPTADIVDVSPDPRGTDAGLVTINFDEDVTGVDIDDLVLTLDGDVVDISGLTLSEVSPSEYVIDLSSLTQASGEYELRLIAVGSGIEDAAGNDLVSDAADEWTKANAVLIDGTLVIEGSDNHDYISVWPRRDDVYVYIRHGYHSFDWFVFDRDDVDQIQIAGNAGNDWITASRMKVPVFIDGGDGRDRIFGGRAGSVLRGGAGNDAIFGGSKKDILIGDTGNDSLLGYGGQDVVIGGSVAQGVDELMGLLGTWQSSDSYQDRVSAVDAALDITDDFERDWLYGGGSRDAFAEGESDGFRDRRNNEQWLSNS